MRKAVRYVLDPQEAFLVPIVGGLICNISERILMEKGGLPLLMAKTVILMPMGASYKFSQGDIYKFSLVRSHDKNRPQRKPGLCVGSERCECTFTVLKKIRNKENVQLH